MKREILKLIGGIPMVVPTGSKALGKNDKVQSWAWSNFHNPARTDGLKLSHWQRVEDVDKDYEYAQFNKKINLVEFSIEDYNQYIKDLDQFWTLEETLYFWDLCRNFDLRFVVIHDRYDPKYNRTIEDLKNRYYTVSRRVLEARRQFDHPYLKSGYSYDQEMKRRACLERIINRSKEETSQENELMKQAEEIEIKIEKITKIEDTIKNFTEETKNTMTFEEYIKNNASENDSFVYLRSLKMKYALPVSDKIQKKVDLLIKELSIPEKLTPTVKIEQNYDNLRNNLIILISLRKHYEKKEREKQKLSQTLIEMQSKVTTTSQRISQSNIINIPTASVIESNDVMSISSASRSKKLTNVNKTRKVILIYLFI